MSLNIPKTFSVTRVSPTIKELEFIYDWCKKSKPKKILEFGCGPTTWAIHQGATNDGLEPLSLYVAMEHWVPSIKDVVNHIPTVKIIKSIWYDIPNEKYDLVFIDSSAGYPPGGSGLYRHKAA